MAESKTKSMSMAKHLGIESIAVKRYFEILLLFLFASFPFGQLFRMTFGVEGLRVTMHLLDLLVILFIPAILYFKKLPANTRVGIMLFLGAVLLSNLYSMMLFQLSEVAVGSFYFIRLIGYFSVFVSVYIFMKGSNEIILRMLFFAIMVSAMIAWIQYFALSDLRWMQLYGWDDHRFRLAGTFVDPGFTGMIFVLGAVVSKYLHNLKGNKIYIISSLFMIITVMFTYSRAAYAALIAAFLIYAIRVLKISIARYNIFVQ